MIWLSPIQSHQFYHLLSEVPPGQKHHEVRPRNLAEALRIILVEQGAPPGHDYDDGDDGSDDDLSFTGRTGCATY